MKQKALGIFFLVVMIAAGLVSPQQVSAQTAPGNYLLIHQIRGAECCSPGGVDSLQTELTAVTDHNLKGYFAFRYDALINSAYTATFQATQTQFPETIKPALLLEVTPHLAAAAGVTYRGEADTWYQAQQAYLLGYEPADRIKLIDYLMAKYKEVFGGYPELTSAWMIDTPSLNYLHQQYGVAVHQTTREQWGLDSYTLYGGPFHYPYPASREWLFMPDYTASDTPMIVRQTVMDPLRVYGDTSSAFTSQPNDYVLDGKDFSYFEKLMDQMIGGQPQPGWVLLGIENSMAETFQHAYAQQLVWLARRVQAGHLVAATVESIRATYGTAQPRVVVGSDVAAQLDAQAIWVTAPRYRLRLLRRGTHWWITDLRVYDAALQDPYATTPARQHGYWVAPFLVDASLTHGRGDSRPWWKRWLSPPEVKSSTAQPEPDFDQPQPNALQLPTMAANGVASISSQLVSYPAATGETVELLFENEALVLKGVRPRQLVAGLRADTDYAIKNTPEQITWLLAGQSTHTAQITSSDNQLRIGFALHPELLAELRQQFYFFFFPEQRQVLSPGETSVAYVHNRYAIAGRNPVRLVMAPRDQQGRPVGLIQAAQVKATRADGDTQATQPVSSGTEKIKHDDVQFFDVMMSEPAAVTVDVAIGPDFTWQEKVYFAPNCGEYKVWCAQHPQQAWWFVRAKVQEKIRAVLE